MVKLPFPASGRGVVPSLAPKSALGLPLGKVSGGFRRRRRRWWSGLFLPHSNRFRGCPSSPYTYPEGFGSEQRKRSWIRAVL